MRTMIEVPVKHHSDAGLTEERRMVIAEEPLEIHINGRPYSLLMRTTGEEVPLAAGFCLSEGLIDKKSDIASIGFCKEAFGNKIMISLTNERLLAVDELLNRRTFQSNTSCGLCGKKMVDEICMKFTGKKKVKLDFGTLMSLQSELKKNQFLFQKTGGAHAALVADENGKTLSSAEDVGRHNAFDKAIGKLILEEKLDLAATALLSSRASFEMIQKAARARIPIVACVSAPTSMAIDLAKSTQITLIGFLRGEDFNVYT